MKILQLSPQFPLPADNGGKIGIYNIYKEFSNLGAEVTFVCFAESADAEQIKIAENYGKVIIIEHSTRNSPARIFKSLFSSIPIYLDKHLNSKIKRDLQLIAKSEEFDVIHADHSAMAPAAMYIKNYRKRPIGLRMHNLEYRIWRRYANSLPKFSPKRFYVSNQGLKLKKAEVEIFGKMDICFAITDFDRKKAIRLNNKAQVKVASAGVNTDEWQILNTDKNRHEMVLATTYDWVHNVEGAKWFVEKVLPIIKMEISDAFLTMIGKHLPSWFYERKHLGINPLGYVDDVKPYLSRANIYVAPLFVGSGIRIKILEALAMKLPVVATRISAEGIKDNYSNGIYVSDNPEEYARIIIDLMNHPDSADAIGENARQFVMQEYSWTNNVEIMMTEYDRLISKYLNR